MHFSTATILAFLATSASAYSSTGRTFAVNHFYGKGNLVNGRMDPIVSPGVPSGHVHAIQGGNAFAMNMTDTQALGSTCTSSLIKNDKSNYWTPSLYFIDPVNGSIESVDLFYMNVYYFFEATTDKIQAFQPGHRMVIGNAELRTPPATGGASILDLADGTPQPVQWTCPRSSTAQPLYPVNSDGLHGVGIQDPQNKGAGVGFPDQNCDGYASPLRADIHFPSCYNPAEGLDSYKTNMQFPTKGNCPSGWIHTPHIFYEVYWDTPKFASRWTQGQGTQPFVLSNGDPTGYSLHADFISGWDVQTLQQIIDNCDSGDSGMDKCPGLIGGVNDPSTSCNMACPIDETIFGALPKLPGNNPIGQWGVSPASPASLVTSAAPAVSLSETSSAPVYSAPVYSAPVYSAPVYSAPVYSAPSVSSAAEVPSITSAAGVMKLPGTSTTAAEVMVPNTSSSPSPTTLVLPTTSEPPANGPVTMVTSYVTTTTDVYTTITLPYPSPSASSISGWAYDGCFSDASTPNRALTGATFVNIGTDMTNSGCIAACEEKSYSLAGTEAGGQCFCGNTLTGGSTQVAETMCDIACDGDASQTCGGDWALSVWKKSMAAKRSSRHFHNHQVRKRESVEKH